VAGHVAGAFGDQSVGYVQVQDIVRPRKRQRTGKAGSVTWTVPGVVTPSCTVRPDTEKRIFMVRNTIFTTWQSAAVSAPNSSVRSLPARHRVAMTFDADEADAEVWRGTRHAGSSAMMFSGCIGTAVRVLPRAIVEASYLRPIVIIGQSAH